MQPPSETLQDGSRVCIEGLQAKPELNGRKGVIRGAFRQDSGRWTVEIDADDKGPNVQVSMRPANLKVWLGTCPPARESDTVSHASVPNVDPKLAGHIPQLQLSPVSSHLSLILGTQLLPRFQCLARPSSLF